MTGFAGQDSDPFAGSGSPGGGVSPGGGAPSSNVGLGNLTSALRDLINSKADEADLNTETTERTDAVSGLNTRVAALEDAPDGEIAEGSVDTDELADGAVTTAKIGALQVTTAKLAAASVTDAKIADAAKAAILALLDLDIDGTTLRLRRKSGLVGGVQQYEVLDSVSLPTSDPNSGGGGGQPPAGGELTIRWGRQAALPTTQAEVDALSDSEATTTLTAQVSYPAGTLNDYFIIAVPTGYEITHINNTAFNNVDEIDGFTHESTLNLYYLSNLRAAANAVYNITIAESE